MADAYCGSDPFGASHYTDEAAKHYLEPNPQRGTDNELWPTNGGIFKNFETARNHLDGGLKNVKVGYPQFYLGGRAGICRCARPQHLQGDHRRLTSQQALDEAAEEWVKIVQKLGIDKQKAQYANFLTGARKLGYKI